jgi:hypothetical protein
MNELVAIYIYDPSVEYGAYKIYACYDNMKDYDERNVAFYDVYENNGICVNEGEPFYTMPSWRDIYEYYWLPSIREASTDHNRDLKILEH